MKIYHFWETSWGPCGLVWEREVDSFLIHLFLPKDGLPREEEIRRVYPQAVCLPPTKTEKDHTHRLQAYLTGTDGSMLPEFVRLEAGPFPRLVLSLTSAIPAGRVSTYGALALRLGKENAARAVGNALAANPLPLIIPCHRVIRAGGYLGNFGGGCALKKKLLEREGIVFDRKGRIPSNYLW